MYVHQRKSFTLSALLTVSAFAAAGPPTLETQQGDPEVEYLLRVDLTPLLAVVRGNHYWLGHLNDDGEFVPDYQNPPQGHRLNRMTSGRLNYTFLNSPMGVLKEKVYEFRAGRL